MSQENVDFEAGSGANGNQVPVRGRSHPDRPNCRKGLRTLALSLSPKPAAAITSVGVRALLGRSLGAEALLQQLVQIGLGPVLVLVEGVHEL